MNLKMNRSQWLVCLVSVGFICLMGVNAGSDSDSDSDSNESGSSGKRNHNNLTLKPHANQPYASSYPYYNQPVYMPQGSPTPYGGYNPPPMPYYYGYAAPSPASSQQIAPMQPSMYPYGAYYNQPPQQQTDYPQAPKAEHFAGMPSGTTTINHSLKVNKEYKEDGHHYKPDGTTIDSNNI